MKSWKVWFTLAMLFVVASPDLMAQCAMCRGTVESTVSNGRSVVASNLNFGILYLLLAPYLIVASIGYLWYRNSKQEHGRRLEIAGRIKRAMSQV
ncbi:MULTISPECIES: hypothetical protein [unclassified Spirosoma]|mgnify:CR=1|uniref:hypothetical protein n=1 Tax=unclassified Spirosoma TaxID=2621999 RepID=UPI000AF23F87|nr:MULTISPECIES: hypothetical protein [unclassified Spirosoma]MBN8822866.1 hypothetical protein [Spirosoma sp.]